MTKPVRFDDEAADELEMAAQWYEARRTNLGFDFLTVVRDGLERIADRPQTWPLARDVPNELGVLAHRGASWILRSARNHCARQSRSPGRCCLHAQLGQEVDHRCRVWTLVVLGSAGHRGENALRRRGTSTRAARSLQTTWRVAR